MAFDSHLSFREKCGTDSAGNALTNPLPAPKRLCFGQAKTEDDEQHGRAGSEPEEWPPAVLGGVDETPRECGHEQITKRISLLQQARDDPPSFWGAILQRGSSDVAIQTAHCNAEQGAARQKLLVRRTKTGSQFEGNEQDVVQDERPFSTPSIGRDTECNGTDGSKHQHEGNSPGDVRRLLAEVFC